MATQPPAISKTLATIDDLKAAPYNPRMISEEAMAGLSVSVDCFGDLSGIVWNSRSGFLVAGHQRVQTLLDKGAELHGPFDGVLRLIIPSDTSDGISSFPIRVVDWDETTERAANIAANNHHIAGEFTDDLQGMLSSLHEKLPEFEELRLNILEQRFIEEINVEADAPVENKPEISFTPELLEEHQYIVFTFSNTLDWQVACKKFGIRSVRALDDKPGRERRGTGRVFPGTLLLDPEGGQS